MQKKILLEYCEKHVAKYAIPREIKFRKDLPKTLVGKVAYRVLEEEELRKAAKQEPQAHKTENEKGENTQK